MKSGWITKKLGEVCETTSGGTPIKSRPEYYEGGTIPWLRSGEVCRKEITESEMFITKLGMEKSSAKMMPKDTVLIAMYGATAAQAGILRFASTTNQAICGILPDQHFLPEFLYYYFKNIESHLAAQAQGGAQPNISQQKIRETLVPIPPLAEQKRIVAKIDAAFEKIDRLKANAEKNLANAKELFQSALDEAMRPKKGWVEKRLGEVCSITSNMVDPTLPQFENMLHVGGGNIICETGDLVDLKTAKEEKLKSGKYLFDMEMVLYNKIRPYLKKVARPFFGGLCSADMYPLLPNSSITRDYLYYLLLTTQFTTYAIGESERAGMPKVNREELFAYCMEIPASLAEQKQIAKQLDSLSQKTKALQQNYERQIADCAEMRQAILREAFEGRL